MEWPRSAPAGAPPSPLAGLEQMAEAVLPFALCAAHAPARFRRGARTYALATATWSERRGTRGPRGVWIESLRDVEGYLQRDGDRDLELEDPAPG